MLHSIKKRRGREPKERKNKCGQRPRKKRVKAQSANVCQRHKSEKNDGKHKLLGKKRKESDM